MDYREQLKIKKRYKKFKRRLIIALLFITFITTYIINTVYFNEKVGETKNYSLDNNTRLLFPTEGVITAIDKEGSHKGARAVDIANKVGNPIYCAMDGKVIFNGVKDGYGNCLIISHENNISTLYGHLNEIFVTEGQFVKLGDYIATMGDSGNSTGPHLHFEIRVNGERVNILDYFPFLEEDLKIRYK